MGFQITWWHNKDPSDGYEARFRVHAISCVIHTDERNQIVGLSYPALLTQSCPALHKLTVA